MGANFEPRKQCLHESKQHNQRSSFHVFEFPNIPSQFQFNTKISLFLSDAFFPAPGKFALTHFIMCFWLLLLNYENQEKDVILKWVCRQCLQCPLNPLNQNPFVKSCELWLFNILNLLWLLGQFIMKEQKRATGIKKRKKNPRLTDSALCN